MKCLIAFLQFACAVAAFGAWPLQTRIDELAAAGGGTLTLTAGVYRTGALYFRPGVNLHLDKDAAIIGVDGAEGYPKTMTRIEGETCEYYPALINADACNGFTISGEGTIDGHGANTWEEFWTGLEAAQKEGRAYSNKTPMRPRLLFVSNSTNVNVSGVTFKNSKFWTTHYYNCSDVKVTGCGFIAEVLKDSRGNDLFGPSTDGIDIDRCEDFVVSNCLFAVNDDAVAIKGGKGPWADDYAKHPENGPSRRVLIADCVMRYPTHHCLSIGSECPEADGIILRDCRIEGVRDLLNLKLRTDTPQRYSNVLVENTCGSCDAFLEINARTTDAALGGRGETELMSYVNGVTMRGNTVVCRNRRIGSGEGRFFIVDGLKLENNRINVIGEK